MTKKTSIKPGMADGYDRIAWMDSSRRTHSVRPIDARSVEEVRPRATARLAGKWHGQRAFQGNYWVAGTQTMVWHESMSEFTALLMLDYMVDIAHVTAQPMLLSFADGSNHTPDYFVEVRTGERILVDVHHTSMMTEAVAKSFALTNQLCDRVGWKYEVMDRFTDLTRWSLEMMARYNHPRYAPDEDTRARILKLASKHPTFGGLRAALRTERPGEHLPAVYHLMWQRAIRFDLNRPFDDRTTLTVA